MARRGAEPTITTFSDQHAETPCNAVDSVGLDYTCDVVETRAGDDVLALVRRGDYAGSSFAFQAFEDEWHSDGGQLVLVHQLISVRLIDTAPCAVPAYEASTVSLRSLAAQVDAPLGDVLDLARIGELRKLLTRTALLKITE